MELAMVKSIQANLPLGWELVEYSELNPHLVLKDAKDVETRLEAAEMVCHKCDRCKNILLAESNRGVLMCPYCGGSMPPTWGEAELCFIPESLLRPADVEEVTKPQRPPKKEE